MVQLIAALLVYSLSAAVVSFGADRVIVKDIVVPYYPPLAKMAGLQGSVTVEIEIGGDGRVLSAREEGGDPILQRAAESNIRLWTFESTAGAKETPLRHTVVYVYKLVGKRVKSPDCPDVVFHLPYRVEISSQPVVVYPNDSSSGSKLPRKP